MEQRRQKREGRVLKLARAQLRPASSEIVESRANDARWFCLQVKNGHDFTVEKLFTDCGVQVLAPRETIVKVKRGKKIEGERAFFPGYLLVRLVPSAEAFAAVRKQDHIVGFVGGESGYHVVRDADVVVFQPISTPDIAELPVDKTIGQSSRCRISAGPLAGLECVVLDVKWKREPRGRVRVEVGDKFVVVDRLPIAFLEKL
ncbi:hypothetical protein YH62_27620 [Rhizobium sp. LC145]|nr:hypothetical protein YH62_27620 [Rhizobium sp. LC145]